MNVMENTSQDVVAVRNMTIKTFQELIFYLLTLNCMSFMLCKPPFSLSSLFSSTMQKMSAIVKPCKDVMVCFHPELFVAPYMYLFTQLNGVWRSAPSKLKRLSDFRSISSLSQYSCDSLIESENLSMKGSEDGGFRNLLYENERTLLQKSVKGVLKRCRKQNIPHQIPEDDVGSNSSKSKEEGVKKRELLQKSRRNWIMKKKFQSDKLAIQKARDEILKKKFEAQKSCHNQIGLLGKSFLQKSLQQGMEIQHQLALADRLLRSAQGMDFRQRASFSKLPPKSDNDPTDNIIAVLQAN